MIMLAMVSSSKKLLAEIEAFLLTHAMAPTAFGVLATKDRHLVRNMRAGRQVTLQTADRIRNFMSTYQSPPRRRSKSSASVAA